MPQEILKTLDIRAILEKKSPPSCISKIVLSPSPLTLTPHPHPHSPKK